MGAHTGTNISTKESEAQGPRGSSSRRLTGSSSTRAGAGTKEGQNIFKDKVQDNQNIQRDTRGKRVTICPYPMLLTCLTLM